MSKTITGATKEFLDTYYPGRGDIGRLAHELAPRMGRDERTVAQMFYNYRDELKNSPPDKFVLYYLWREVNDHPVSDWARACLDILKQDGGGLPV